MNPPTTPPAPLSPDTAAQPAADDALRRTLELRTRQLNDALAELAKLRQELIASERLAELGTLTGGLAHEIKNPLSTVQLNLQLLSEDVDPAWPGATRVTSRLATVQRETARLRDILDDFLRYAGKLELDLRPIDLQLALSDLADFFEPQARLARVNIRVKPGPPVLVRADERLLKQTLLNLMLNAVQAMPDGGDLLLSTQSQSPWGVAHVTDTGVGIRPEALPRIFDAYYSTKKGGTGLGLAMARRILREHGGDVSVNSEPGKGSDFMVRLPSA